MTRVKASQGSILTSLGLPTMYRMGWKGKKRWERESEEKAEAHAKKRNNKKRMLTPVISPFLFIILNHPFRPFHPFSPDAMPYDLFHSTYLPLTDLDFKVLSC
ncbi:hypothetical protein M434DRAFT_211467 [Hypoxylon sp. CO27-5]|nr:hypothetical protein M434DRAFT_211467 [Hypoxylon sp. CO27-5]